VNYTTKPWAGWRRL